MRFGLALVVLAIAAAAIIISRRNYAKSAVFERSIEAFRLEFQRSIDAAQAATVKTIGNNIFSVVKTINSTVKDLSARLARLEEHADETATHIAGTQNLDVRLTRLEEHADATVNYTQNLDVRFARLQERADETAAHIAGFQNLDVRLAKLQEQTETAASQIAGIQKQSLEENERIGARLAELEQNLTALTHQLSLIKQTIDGATAREQDIKDSIEAVSSRVLNTQTRVDELFPRLVLGEKAREDLATLIGLFVKRLKKLNANSTEIALRLGHLESHFHSKARQPEDHHSSTPEGANCASTNSAQDQVEDAAPKAADGAVLIEAKTNGEHAGIFEQSPPGKESSNEASVEGDDRPDKSRADQHPR